MEASRVRAIKRKLQESVRPLLTVVAVAVCGLVGAYLLTTSHAATPTASIEAEGGSVSSAASIVADTSASSGHAVKFGAGSGTSASCKATTISVPSACGFPDATNTGVPKGATLTAYTGPDTITSCGTVIDHKIITTPIYVNATNNQAAVYGNEAAAKAAACVTFTNDLIQPAACGSGCAGVYTGAPDYAGGGTNCYQRTGHPCGPVYIADTEISMPQSDTGYAYVTWDTNVHVWRAYMHGTDQTVTSNGWSEVHDSYLVADRCNSSNCSTHGDAFFSDGGPYPELVDHNTLICGGTPAYDTDCSGDIGFYGDETAVTNATVTNNLFKAADPVGLYYWCAYTGAEQDSKPFPKGTNLVWTGNVFEKGPSGKCGGAGPVADWANNSGNVWSNNTWSDGTALNE